MTVRKQMAWLLAAAAAAAPAVASASTSLGAGASVFAASDSEGFDTQRLAFNYLPVYLNRYELAGLALSGSRFSQDGWRRDTSGLSAMYRKVDPATLDGLQVEGGYNRQGGHGLLTVDANYHATLAPKRSIELFFNRDWVETQRALETAVAFSYAGASLEQGLGEHVTVVGMAGYQDFTDGNHRRHARAKLIVQPSLALGLTLQARYRVFYSGDEIAPTYFNPARYDETMLAVGFRKRIQGWVGNITAGVGRQRVGDAERTPSRLLEVGLESPLRQLQSVRLRAGYNNSASFGGPDYRYRYAQAEWLIGF